MIKGVLALDAFADARSTLTNEGLSVEIGSSKTSNFLQYRNR